ncbi:uncharacterized protein HRG_07594 [Hirsutella rhossiliensis]|uniref:CHCH domain-containing protein n=1 Tax=Hirsutella rhossiliensis TaxID=111463 RepID=A0A9P8SG78_9HYPO|nr:uncharacterized protein HRG_07594 [Hirsutella rhossiliensis]KAH0961516.1 hypothetical protein HRG_07594 [Hirsutella rhossiliensis]
MATDESKTPPPTAAEVDEPDEWDKRIFSTGCADENAKMTDCYFEKRDWRACTAEMERFKECWQKNGNEERTSSKGA